eukprot:scaffold1982_cov93-Amphora_coffeaeformis.AAC.46
MGPVRLTFPCSTSLRRDKADSRPVEATRGRISTNSCTRTWSVLGCQTQQYLPNQVRVYATPRSQHGWATDWHLRIHNGGRDFCDKVRE